MSGERQSAGACIACSEAGKLCLGGLARVPKHLSELSELPLVFLCLVMFVCKQSKPKITRVFQVAGWCSQGSQLALGFVKVLLSVSCFLQIFVY